MKGGTQSYCCRGFQPSLQQNRDPELVRPQDLDSDPTSLAKRDVKSCASTGVIVGGAVAVLSSASGPLAGLLGLSATGVATVSLLLGQAGR